MNGSSKPISAESGPVLRLRGVHAGYGDIKVLHGVSLAVQTGTVTAIIGSNGAGKTTLMRAISGLIPVTGGSIELAARDATNLPASERVAAGICLVPEGRLIFSDFTVEENLLIGGFTPRTRRKRQELIDQLYARYPRLRERRRQRAGTLSGGEQQMLALARGLMSEPRILLLDEPSLGLAPKVVAQLFEMILEIRRAGITVCVVEQNVLHTLEIADYAYVLENGHLVTEGSGSALLADERVRQAYLGL
jgi:branched-chain amino acid transport system ATP-binding protein